ncbi:MAG: MFS transporter, partial [Patescibacteria group bacterium]
MNKKLLYTISFFIKGLEVGILLLLPVFQTQGIITVFQVGLLGATMSSFQIISNLQTGHLAEKFGGKNILALGIGMYATAWLSLGILPNVEILFFAYALAGIGSGVFIPIANSFVVKISDKNRSTEMGNFSAYTDLGRVLFSSVTIILVGLFSTARTSLFYAVSALILLLIFISRIKRNRDMHEALSSEENLEKIKILSLLKEKKYVLSVVTGIFDGFSSASLYIFIPLLLVPRGIFLSTIGLLSSLFFLGYFSGRLL